MANLPASRFPVSIAARSSRWKWFWTGRAASRAGAVLVGFLVSGVCGATTAIEVRFELNLPAMTDLWPRDQGGLQKITVERKVTSALRDRLQELFRYWKFDVAAVANPGAQAKPQEKAPRITFRLHEELINEALLTLELEIEGQRRPLVLDEVLWPPSQFWQAALFGPPRAQKEIPGFFSKKLIEKPANFRDIEEQLMASVPLAEGGRWRTPNPGTLPPAIVLPLPYDLYEDLRESEFQLVCEKNRSVTRLIAVGTGQSDSYPFSDGPKKALVASPLQDGHQNPSPAALKSNKPRYVFLNRYLAPSPMRLGSPEEAER